jgi:hypothetical protein
MPVEVTMRRDDSGMSAVVSPTGLTLQMRDVHHIASTSFVASSE